MLDEKAKDLRRAYNREYYREWAKRNRDKIKANQERYWQRKADKRQQELKAK